MVKLSSVAPELPAADLALALKHYQQRLGFVVAMQLSDYAMVERDGVALHLFEDRARRHSPVGVHIFTPDLDALYAEMTESGALLTQGIETKP